MSPTGQTSRQRHDVLRLSICSSVAKLVNMILWKRLNQFWCQLAQVLNRARAWNGQLCGSGQRSRSHEASDRHQGVVEASLSTLPLPPSGSSRLSNLAHGWFNNLHITLKTLSQIVRCEISKFWVQFKVHLNWLFFHHFDALYAILYIENIYMHLFSAYKHI